MKHLLKLSFVLFAMIIMVGCGGIAIDDIQSVISEVTNGNTIVLESGTTVHLRGVKASNTFTKNMLDKYVGKEVSLLTDENDSQKTIDSYDEEVECYATLVETGEDLSEVLLTAGGENAYDANSVEDFHKKKYDELIFGSGPDPKLEKPLLSARLKAATMLVVEPLGNGTASIGSAFFIGNDGLALTNNHVIEPSTRCKVYISDANGDIDYEQPFNLKRVVYSDDDYDYTIFYVDLDPTALKRITYLKLSKDKEFRAGTEIGVVGNPAPGEKILTMSFATGEISRFEEESGKIQITAPITHGFSGGPTTDYRAHVIGISQGGFSDNNANLNFAVDIRLVRDKLEELNLPYAGK